MFVHHLALTVMVVSKLLSGFQKPEAYLDPGTGSLVLQALLAGLFAALLSIRVFWRQIKAFFGRLTSKGRQEGGEDDDKA